MSNTTVSLPAQTAGGSTVSIPVLAYAREDGNGVGLEGVTLTAPTTVTGAATNNATISVRQLRAGSVVATLGTVTLASGTNLTAEVPFAIVPLGVAAAALQAGDVIDVHLVQNGTGLAIPGNVLVTVTVS